MYGISRKIHEKFIEYYPFSREVLYNTEKRKLIIHLLDMPYQCFQLFE